MNNITINDVENNQGAIIEAVEIAWDIQPEEISIDNVHDKTPSGNISVNVGIPKNTEIPEDFAKKLQEELRLKPGFSNVKITEPSISFKLFAFFNTYSSFKNSFTLRFQTEILCADLSCNITKIIDETNPILLFCHKNNF
jgi:hypothetical protein